MPIMPPPRSDPYQRLPIDDFGYGLLTRDSISKVPHGAAVRSINCDYEGRVIANRKGYKAVHENGPGAVQLADFESGESWSAGAANTTDGEFVLTLVTVDGTRSLKVSSTVAGGSVTTELTIAATDMGTGPFDVFNLFLFPNVVASTVTDATVTLELEDSSANKASLVIAEISSTATVNAMKVLEQGIGRTYRLRRKLFILTGALDWTDIVKIRIIVDPTAGSGALDISFDNLHRTPGKMQDLFQFERQEGEFQGAKDELAVADGKIWKSDRRRWAQIFDGFDQTRPVYSITAQNRRILADGVTSPRQLMSDGSTVYRLGIVTPPKQITATQLFGTGQLPDGKYFVQVLFYSSKTGSFSAPDDRIPATELIEIAGGSNTAGIRFSNIPVSSDAQVDWVIIAIRPEIEPNLFLRASDGAFGEVPNGTTTFDFNGSVTELLARSGSAIDPDMDYPSVIDGDTGLPVEGHPTFLLEIGGYIVTVFKEQPTVLRISRFRAPGSWALDDEIPVGENDSDAISGLAKVFSTLIVMKNKAVYYGRVVGGDTKILLEGPYSNRGAVDHKGMVNVGHLLFYRGEDGIYKLSNDMTPRQVTAEQLPTWQTLWAKQGFGEGAAVVVKDREQVIHFGRQLADETNEIGWVTHYRTVVSATPRPRGKWPQWAATLHTIPSDVATEVESDDGFEPWTGGMGQVWRINYGHSDDGRKIETIHRTTTISPGRPRPAIWKWLDIEGAVSGDFDLEVDPFMGEALVPGTTLKASMKGQSSPLGEFVLGTSRLGAPTYLYERLKLPKDPCRYVQFELRFLARVPLEVRLLVPWFMFTGEGRATTK